MKKFLSIVVLFCLSFFAFAEKPIIKVDDEGNHIYETTIANLVSMEFRDKICIQNGSSYLLKNIHCTVYINGQEHRLLPIDQVKTGRDDNFDGLEDDDMKDEFPYYFGPSGKFVKDNRNPIKFVIKFGDNNDKIVITDIQFRDHDMYFYVENDPNFKVTEQIVEDSVKVIIVDGKKYMLINDKVIEIKD